jgi:hypothetical protein
MQANEQAEVIEQYLAAYNAFDVDGMLNLLSPDVRFENWSGGQLTASVAGIDAFRQLAEHAKTIFSEREQRIVAFKRGADPVVVSIGYRGQLAVDIPDGPPAGTVLELEGESEFAFDGRLISSIVDRS